VFSNKNAYSNFFGILTYLPNGKIERKRRMKIIRKKYALSCVISLLSFEKKTGCHVRMTCHHQAILKNTLEINRNFKTKSYQRLHDFIQPHALVQGKRFMIFDPL
jgi:hypothetical protein